uniref:Carboxypeptidase n=1 Tax=Rhabditophanes sp. KR3021 TaxID=114890 RepID=A0AC35TQF7_9BILA
MVIGSPFFVLSCFFIAVATFKSSDYVDTLSGRIKYSEDWSYTDIREDCHSFWWLFAKDENKDENRPLILWLQGGPGASSSGFGNMEEIGPKSLDGSDRNYTWLQVADLVFVDNPVGAGFSYVDKDSAYSTNLNMIANDLLTWAIDFFSKQHPEYQNRPFYIFSESYGGKMTAEFARFLFNAKRMGKINVNFAGVGLGDSWISAMDFVNTWPDYLRALSFLDGKDYQQLKGQAQICDKLVKNNKWDQATDCWGDMENLVGNVTNDVSWYNILKRDSTDDWSILVSKPAQTPKEHLYNHYVQPLQADALADFMNVKARKKFGIIPNKVQFGGQSGNVFDKQSGDFMKPNYYTVDYLLQSNVPVSVYNGQLDLICDTLGVNQWMSKMLWNGLGAFDQTTKVPFYVKGSSQTAGFKKAHKNLSLYYIMRAGHMMAYDSPYAVLKMVSDIIGATVPL